VILSIWKVCRLTKINASVLFILYPLALLVLLASAVVATVQPDAGLRWDARTRNVTEVATTGPADQAGLRVGDQVLGTLDVESAEVNAFTQEDVLVIQSLGDQIAIAIENARLYDRSRELAILEERHRLARELHDSVTQSLFSLDLHAKAIATYLKRDPQQAEAQIQQLRQITHDTLREMRSLIFDLRPTSLKDIGLVPALRQWIEHLRRPDGPELVLHATGERRIPAEVEQDLFRIAQEALSNAIKHAGARHIVVELTIESEQATLRVTDDGCGFDPVALFQTNRRAFGLIGMR
jgi:signal transduction histidine kinase